MSCISFLPNTEVVSQVPIAVYKKRKSTRFGATDHKIPAAKTLIRQCHIERGSLDLQLEMKLVCRQELY